MREDPETETSAELVLPKDFGLPVCPHEEKIGCGAARLLEL
jgi:hypothetical protein